MSDCTHEWGFDLLGNCKGCAAYVTDDERQKVNRAIIVAALVRHGSLVIPGTPLPFDEAAV